MIAVDTNVLIRILVDDDTAITQVKIARQLAQKSKEIFIPQIVQIELIWVLQIGYKTEKAEVLHILDSLLENEAFILQNEMQFQEALHLYRTSNTDFSDCLMLVESLQFKCKVVTFDKKFSKLPNVELLA